jgi:hypothetical protein
MNCNTRNSQIFIQAPDFQIPIQTLTLTLAPNFTIHNLKQLFFKNKSYPSTLTSSSYFTLDGRILPDNDTVKTTGIQDFAKAAMYNLIPEDCGGFATPWVE